MHNSIKNLIANNAPKALLILMMAAFFGIKSAQAAPDGKALFSTNCASCHNPIKDATGPALKGVSGRIPGKEWLYKWIHNSAAVIASGDKYANEIYNKWGKQAMTQFPQLSTEEIDAIIGYVEAYEPPVKEPTNGGGGTGGGNSTDNTFLYFIITSILAILAFVLMRVNKKLSYATAEKVGLPIKKDIPWFRNKLYIALLGVVAFIALGAWMTRGGIKLGRQQNYKPVQPIYYSHKVHAGINQINCQYCHSAAEKSKHAMIPSVNVCMNCHKGINEYSGAEEHPLVSDDGDKVNGTAEIAKMYGFAGWDPVKKAYTKEPTPIPWVKIHNLPDHVSFNHNTHVKNGQVPCQRCHGPIQEMDEVYQFSSLSMGFCINCHRESKVQFAENNYYSIYKKYHEEMANKERDSVTVAEVGGLECSKCHY